MTSINSSKSTMQAVLAQLLSLTIIITIIIFFPSSNTLPPITTTSFTSRHAHAHAHAHAHPSAYTSSLSSLASPRTKNAHSQSSRKGHANAVVVERKRRGSRKSVKEFRDCDIFDGRWVVDYSPPLYGHGSCPFVDDAFNCVKNGRPDSGFNRLRWKPFDCRLPRFNGLKMLKMLKMLRGKRIVFVGDSLNRNMWESLVCALRDSLTDKSKVSEVSDRHEFRTQGFYSFQFEDFNCSIDFIRSPFLVQEWRFSDKAGARRETLRLDMFQRPSVRYHDADVIIFNTGHWWTHQKTYKGRNYFQEGNHVYNKLEVPDAYTRALRTWANWVDSNINSSRTKVFFRGYSASHFKGGQWNSGGNCDGETRPITNDSYLAPYPWMMRVLESVIAEMKTPVSYLNITKMTDYRKDGHPSIFRLPKEQIKPGLFQDCSHWCLPGVPDAWNELLYAILVHYYTDLS